MKNADDDTKSDFKKFQRVIRELQERLDRTPKSECTSQKNVFQMNIEPAESSDEGSDIKNNQETEQASPKDKQRHKRTEIQSLKSNASKKTVSECPACD